MATAVALCGAPAQAATMLSVGKSEGCGKTTCFNDKGRFTQTWSSAGAAGPVSIGQLLLDRGVLGSLDGSRFRISFQLDGKEIGTWGSFAMGGIAGDQLTFQGENFTWNPEDGDLTLVLEIFKPGAGAGGFGRFSAPNQLGAPNNGPEGDPEDSPELPNYGGAIVDAVVPSVTAVPEPATWALMIGGFGLAGASLRRRARVVA